jgi:hypothetical protein
MEEELKNIIFIERDFDYYPVARKEVPSQHFSLFAVLINHSCRLYKVIYHGLQVVPSFKNQKSLLR